MRQRHIDFRELLERLLPIDELPALERLRVERALKTGVAAQLERAALEALSRLEQQGALRRLPPNGDQNTVRYQPREGLDVITFELPEPRRQDGVLAYPRSALPTSAQARLDQVQRLLRIDDPLLGTSRQRDARQELIERLNEAGREILGAHDLRFVPSSDAPELRPLAAALADEARANPDRIYYCPDTRVAPALADAARQGVAAAVFAGVSSSDGTSLGHLEVTSGRPDPLRTEDLALIALLADSCALALDRSARIEKLVFIDPLTAAYNRTYFEMQVENEMARAQREQGSMALCIADIDNFKSFNTHYGYSAGNQVLVQVARALKGALRPFDSVARWGGEEFAVLLTAPVQAEDVQTVSERLRSLVERQTVQLEGLDGAPHRVGVTVSIGVAMFPDHAKSAEDLWRAANQALLEAKRPPKNRVVFVSGSGAGRLGAR